MSRTEDSDFSQGDPPAFIPQHNSNSSAQGDRTDPNKNDSRQRRRTKHDAMRTVEPLHPSTSTEDSLNKRPSKTHRNPNADSSSFHKGFLSLLSTTNEENYHVEQEGDGEKTNTATLFDLRIQDRLRVGKLIEELTETTDVVDTLKKQMDANKIRFRKRKSDLMKKVDALGEKCEMLKTEKQQLQDKYLAALRNLEDNVSTISEQFESSVREIRDLR